jgi:hypothetical protein
VAELLAGVAGYTVCPRDPGQLGEQLARLLAARPRVEGRRAIRERGLDLESVARRVLRIYEDSLVADAVRREPFFAEPPLAASAPMHLANGR